MAQSLGKGPGGKCRGGRRPKAGDYLDCGQAGRCSETGLDIFGKERVDDDGSDGSNAATSKDPGDRFEGGARTRDVVDDPGGLRVGGSGGSSISTCVSAWRNFLPISQGRSASSAIARIQGSDSESGPTIKSAGSCVRSHAEIADDAENDSARQVKISDRRRVRCRWASTVTIRSKAESSSCAITRCDRDSPG